SGPRDFSLRNTASHARRPPDQIGEFCQATRGDGECKNSISYRLPPEPQRHNRLSRMSVREHKKKRGRLRCPIEFEPPPLSAAVKLKSEVTEQCRRRIPRLDLNV